MSLCLGYLRLNAHLRVVQSGLHVALLDLIKRDHKINGLQILLLRKFLPAIRIPKIRQYRYEYRVQNGYSECVRSILSLVYRYRPFQTRLLVATVPVHVTALVRYIQVLIQVLYILVPVPVDTVRVPVLVRYK